MNKIIQIKDLRKIKKHSINKKEKNCFMSWSI